jgi:hypothetical protein
VILRWRGNLNIPSGAGLETDSKRGPFGGQGLPPQDDPPTPRLRRAGGESPRRQTAQNNRLGLRAGQIAGLKGRRYEVKNLK